MNTACSGIETPCFIVDAEYLRRNLEVLRRVSDESGGRVLLAQKAFALYRLYPLIAEYLDGATSSGLFEARLAFDEMRAEGGRRLYRHIFAPAYQEGQIDEILTITDHIVFNSAEQFKKYKDKAAAAGVSRGIRVNPEFSTQDKARAIYDPCAPGSRLGVKARELADMDFDGVEGLHFHTMCEQGFDDLAATFDAVERKFGGFLKKIKWLNMGGGQHITADGYDVDGLIRLIKRIISSYGVEVYIEPGEAVALNAGFLAASVLDIVEGSGSALPSAIIDASAACHMPDVIEAPYRPHIISGGAVGQKKYAYRIGGNTCLAGDIVGDYSFDAPLEVGSKLIFTDMAHYSMVKTNMFNGINLPSIYLRGSDGRLELIKKFGYGDYKSRLC
ncbi:MAG: carboxynorspermidine decarboxylase [Clostridiales bacterium]|jgi:carboxynorspermidine decarboxylase|nr:carboxynorspermidine decarboxylase [Clostridiales bacterium]